MKRLFYIIVLLAICIACDNFQGTRKKEPSEKRAKMEIEGQKCLTAARSFLGNKDFNAARENIELLRKDYPLALNAREEAILLSDSIELLESQQQLKNVDSLITIGQGDSIQLQHQYDELCQKVKFYLRKLQYDKNNQQKH